MASVEQKDNANFEMVDPSPPSPYKCSHLPPFPGTTGAETCPNSHDCLIGHPELRLEHIASARRCGFISKLFKAFLGLTFLTWAILFDVALHSAHKLSHLDPSSNSTNNNSSSSTVASSHNTLNSNSGLKLLPPTQLQQRLQVPLFILAVTVAMISQLVYMMSVLALIMREYEKKHPGVEVYLKHPWWLDRWRLDFCILVAAHSLLPVTAWVTRDWHVQS
ncbi:hypothetical protein AA313_de0207333 [Arthrobotrys entomopaga]|nr:hypothetical protein AA313_de0207333 [Arthrobotrys entomopaga]